MDLNLREARYSGPPRFLGAAPQRKETPAQANGRRYEAKVGRFVRFWALGNRYEFKDHPWIEFRDRTNKVCYCQPDYVLLSELDDNLIIIEAKYRHTRDSIAQLDRYSGIIGLIHPERVVSKIEICRYFDVSECRMELLDSIRPHNFAHAAVIFEPQSWMGCLN